MCITARGILTAFAVIWVCATAQAQRIPPSEMLGRERERFTDPQPPRAQPGPMFSAPYVTYSPGSTKRHRHTARSHRK
jgi:hypothetical protein